MRRLITGPAAEFTFRRKRFLLVPVPTDANGNLLPHNFPNCYGCFFDQKRYEDRDGFCIVDDVIERTFGIMCTDNRRIFIRKSKEGVETYEAQILKGKLTT